MSFIRFIIVAAMAVTAPYTVCAQTSTPTPSNPNAPVTRAEIPELVKQAILNDPDIIMQAAQKLRDKEAAQEEIHAKDSIEKHKADITGDPDSPTIGNVKNADITLVEFFDYHCGYCKHMLPAMTQLIQDDKNVRVVFKEFPILSEDSVTAARAALAVYRIEPTKYFEFHTALMQSSGKFDEKAIMTAAKKAGINPDKLKTEMAKPEITAELDKNRAMGEDLGIRGTPALLVGDHLVPGAMSYDDLKKTISDARSGKKPT